MNFKKLILTLSILCAFTVPAVSSEVDVLDSNVKSMIQQYKDGNYTGCLQSIDEILVSDPSNIYAHYYQGLSFSQLGEKTRAIESYEKVIALNGNRVIVDYATKGKACLTSVEACEAYQKTVNELDDFIKSDRFLDKSVQQEMNKKKLNRMRQEINKEMKGVKPEKKSEMPSNDEIAEAVKTLAKVGFNPLNSSGMMNMYQTPEMIQANMLLGNNDSSNHMNNMLPYFLINQSQNGASKMSPELIQTMMMSQMQMY